MNKNKFLFIGLLSALLVFGFMAVSCGEEGEVWGGSVSTLDKLVIAGSSVDLGRPNADAALATPGSVTLKSAATDEDGEPTLIVGSPTINIASNFTVKYAVNQDVATPPEVETYGDKPDSLKNSDILWLQVTGKSTLYYVIKVKVEYTDVVEINNILPSRQLTLAQWNAAVSAQTLTIYMNVENSRYTYQWYKASSPSPAEGDEPISGAISNSYTPVITANGTYYYYVVVTIPATSTTEERTRTSNVAVIKIVSAIKEADIEFTIGRFRRNYVRGVGGTGSFMFREGSNADASPDADVKYIDLLMGELGANILRIMVQDDYLNYIQDTVQSRNKDTFFHNASKNFFPVIQRANEYGGYVFANPWTAPANMKSGSSLAGGNLNVSSYVAYADHLRDFLKWLNTNNAPIFALGILNEPDFGGGANYEGMGMTGAVTRDWFKTVGNFTTQKVRNPTSAGTTTSQFDEDIIPGFGGGGPTHHVLAMSGDSAGNIAGYMDPQLDDSVANNKIELMGRHYYSNSSRYTRVVGGLTSNWADRPQLDYAGPYEAESLAQSRQMYAPGSEAGKIKREVWQTEHDFNFHSNSTTPPTSNPQNYWNSAFALLNDIDWCLRVVGESVFDWWYSSSYSGLVTSYQTAGFPPYTITPRGRAFAHYARYVNETWLLAISNTKPHEVDPTIEFNKTGSSASPTFNAGATDPKISAFEDVNGKFISIVMYAPSRSTNNGAIGSSFGAGGTSGRDDPTVGSTNVGSVSVVMPNGFVGTSASAIRSYGNALASDEAWDDVPAGTPRYWIDEPVFLSEDGKSVEVTLPGGNIISIMVKGGWTDEFLESNNRHFEERVRPFTVK